MRILYHHRTRGRHVEGVHIRGIVGALRGLGHEVTVLSFPGADPEHEHSTPTGAPVHGIGGLVTRLPGVLFEFFEVAYNLVVLLRLPRALRRTRAQLVYERYSLFMFASIWLTRQRGIPIILEINDSALVERVRPLWMKRPARRIEAWCLRHATGLVFISRQFQQQAEAAYGAIAPSVVSPNAADISCFDPARFNGGPLRRERGIGGQVVCGYVGAFAHWHGTAEFAARITMRLREQPQLTLLLVGDGRDLPAVRAQVSERGLGDRVILPGRVAHTDIASWIACMDYAVLPDSNQYGSPMKVFEFMAMGVAVVAPDYEPLTEVVTDGRTGWLFPRGDVDACVDKVLALADDLAQCARVGQTARDYIVGERQWRNNAEQLLTLVPSSVSH
ncbi:glycosyl transferase family 1 [Dyella lipolytica]|uniref:Glycosyltransferase n=1 Tax=Dyella lipolytica TaxID=1867835 RepID=A0ABW8IW62_9GAMM|nr:glycosyltransferase [Dyella lipolytica]GLQ46124.1 glycosyl transferase family 1 [Dyella lipolytica]